MILILNLFVLFQPWTIMQSLDVEKQRDAISAAITAIYEEPSVPEEVRTTFTDVMKGIINVMLYPLTSTQLGIFSNFLDIKKLDVLRVIDARANDFKERFLDVFVQKPEHSQDIANINEAIELRPRAAKTMSELFSRTTRDFEAEIEACKDFYKLPGMTKKRYDLRDLFHEELKNKQDPLAGLPPGELEKLIRKNPRFVSGIANTFNVLGAVGATYSVFREIFTPNSGFRQGNPRDVLSVVATAIGGVGSIKGTIDVAKLLKEKLFRPRQPTSTTKFYGTRSAEELGTFEEQLATEFSVDLNNMQRATTRLARMSQAAKLGRVFTALGVVADGIFFGISIYDLYKDFTADNLDPWKIADDFAFAASAGIGAALGGW